MSTFEPDPTTALLTAEARKLLELFGRAIRAATPERTQAWEQRIERVLEDGRALIEETERGERIEHAMLNPRPMRRLWVVRKQSTAERYLAATDDGREPKGAA
jgi:hypothetical protein